MIIIKNSFDVDKKKSFHFKERVIDILELPRDIVFDLPRIIIIGNRRLIVENFKTLIEFNSEKIRLDTKSGLLFVKGTQLNIKEITSEDIVIEGYLKTVDYE